jgi:hypothetical protein
MADNYTQFSTMIENLTESERAWCVKYLEELAARSDEEIQEQGDCGIALESEGLWLYAEEYGDVEFAALVIQEFLKNCRPDKCFGFEWANTCSKPRIDEFSGGGVFITATDMKWFNPTLMISEAIHNFTKGGK